jgi:hypothetical protein
MRDEAIVAEVSAAIERADGDAFERALNEAWHANLPAAIGPLLVQALPMTWHTRHEDVVHALQRLREPTAVEALYREATAVHGYLEYDEEFGLARKCTWALADIGTEEARSRLEELSRNANATIAAFAQKRLDHWDEERDRKGKTS